MFVVDGAGWEVRRRRLRTWAGAQSRLTNNDCGLLREKLAGSSVVLELCELFLE